MDNYSKQFTHGHSPSLPRRTLSPTHKKGKSASLFKGLRSHTAVGDVYDEKPQQFELQKEEELKEPRKQSLDKSERGGLDAMEQEAQEEYMQLLLEKWKSRKDRSLIRKKLVNVLIIYSGGTIGMKMTQKGLKVREGFLEQLFRSHQILYDKQFVEDTYGPDSEEIVTPLTLFKQRIRVKIKPTSVIIDSCNMNLEVWVEIGKFIQKEYEHYDSFVILHGTDTMAYTASVLSFLLEGLSKTVVITGSMLPIVDMRSDGYSNLIGSLLVAGQYRIPEVLIYFNNKLLRGNRTVKISSAEENAFDTPNFSHLGDFGVHIKINWGAVLKAPNQSNFAVFTDLSSNISSIKITPLIHKNVFASAFDPSFEAVVIQGYALGNFPNHRTDLLDIVLQALKRGTLVVIASQVVKGIVIDSYQVLRELTKCGAIMSFDMTFECTLTKLSYLLGKYKDDKAKIKKLFQTDLRGELSEPGAQYQQRNTFSNGKFVHAVAQQLQTSLPEDYESISKMLNPYFVNAAAATVDVNEIKTLENEGFDFDEWDMEGLTPLHCAAREGRTDIVEFLLTQDIDINFTNQINPLSPLAYALKFRNFDIARLLLSKNAQFIMPSHQYRNLLQAVGEDGDLDTLKILHQTHSNLEFANYDQRTVAHIAASAQHWHLLEFLLTTSFDFSLQDRWGYTVAREVEESPHVKPGLLEKLKTRVQPSQTI